MKKHVLFLLLTSFTLIVYSRPNPSDTLRVITYNIRNCHAADGPNKWDKRKPKVFALIKKYNPDILGMQEVLLHQLKNLRGALKQYDYVGVGRNDGKTKGEYSPVFYKKDKFKLLNSGNFWMSETPDVPGSKSWDAALTRICSWAELQLVGTDSILYVFNTHLDHRGEIAREKSMAVIAAHIKQIAGSHAVILSGDFNCTPDSKPYAALGTEMPQMKDTYKAAARHLSAEVNSDYGFNVSNKNGNKIDYIFCSPAFEVESCENIADNNGTYYPSDHLPFFATIILFSAHK